MSDTSMVVAVPRLLWTIEAIRATSLRDYEACPAGWAAKHLSGLKGDESKFGVIGTAVHVILETYARNMYHGPFDGDMQLVADAIGKVPEKELPALREYTGRFQLTGGVLLGLEYEFTMQIIPGAPPLRGHIDMITAHRDQTTGRTTLLITDHKTNRGWSGEEYWRNDIQPLAYMYACKRLFPGYDSYQFIIGQVNMPDDIQWDMTDEFFDVEFVARFANAWGSMLEQARVEVWNERLNKWCNSCPLRSNCQVYADSTVGFIATFKESAGVLTVGEKYQYLKSVEKVVGDLLEDLKRQITTTVEQNGGEPWIDSGYSYSLSQRGTRKAQFSRLWNDLVAVASQSPTAAKALNDRLDDIFTVKVTGLDTLMKADGSFILPINANVEKVDNAGKTLVATVIAGKKKQIAK